MKKRDVIIIISVLAIAAIFSIIFFCLNSPAPMNAVITVNGAVYERIPLNEQTIEIKNEYGRNLIHISKDGAEIIEADCPNQTCIKTGKITNSGDMIICLPHHLIVILEDNGSEENQTDAVSQ